MKLLLSRVPLWLFSFLHLCCFGTWPQSYLHELALGVIAAEFNLIFLVFLLFSSNLFPTQGPNRSFLTQIGPWNIYLKIFSWFLRPAWNIPVPMWVQDPLLRDLLWPSSKLPQFPSPPLYTPCSMHGTVCSLNHCVLSKPWAFSLWFLLMNIFFHLVLCPTILSYVQTLPSYKALKPYFFISSSQAVSIATWAKT